MRIIGSKEKIGFVVDRSAPHGIAVEIWANNACLTPYDRHPYLPAFLPHLVRTEARLRQIESFTRHENELTGMTVEDAFGLLAGQGSAGLNNALRCLDWGPTTDDVLCFLIPSMGVLRLTWKLRSEGRVQSVSVEGGQLADLICELRDVLEESGK